LQGAKILAPLNRKEVVLIVDDQQSSCETLKRFLRRLGYRTSSCTSADEALECLAQERIDLVLTDFCMPKKNGLELLDDIKALGGGESVIVMTAFATIDQCVEIMRRGATDYIAKPFRLEAVAKAIDRALLSRRQQLDSKADKQGNGNTPQVNGGRSGRKGENEYKMRLVGHSPAMQQLFTMIDRIALTDSSVLITGATGTGKEIVARQIHEKSERRNKPFIDINCSAIPDTLIEAELFGHQRGTFTGADETRQGLFEEASGGTLFLDEVDALGLTSQAKLLRVLQERHVRRVGGRKNIPVDVRIISATNRDLHQAIANGTFRHDLLYRLCVVPLHLPGLYERGEDVALLIQHFLQQHAERLGTSAKSVSAEAMKKLLEYRWPGNVRELENTLEYALAIGIDTELGIKDLPPTLHAREPQSVGHSVLEECLNDNSSLSEVERRYVLLMLERQDGHQINTAAALGIDRRTLSRKLQQYGTRILRKEVNGREEPSTRSLYS
jgi:DNA-binding NtrC family response regulator